MRIASNTTTDAMLRQIQQLTYEQAKLQQQVGSGMRITQPEDDPAAVGRVLMLQNEQRQLAQFSNNANRALALAQSSYVGLQGLKKISDRASELATLGTSTLGDEAMKTYATELDQLIEQALQIANSRSGNDYLYAGTEIQDPKPPAPATPPFAQTVVSGQITSVSYPPDDGTAPGYYQQAEVQLSEATSVKPATSGQTNSEIATFLNNMIALRDALGSGDTTAVSSARSNLVSSEDAIINAMAECGGVQTRIEAAKAQYAEGATNLAARITTESSVDLPTAIVKLTQTQTAYQAALASTTKVMNLSLLDYIQ